MMLNAGILNPQMKSLISRVRHTNMQIIIGHDFAFRSMKDFKQYLIVTFAIALGALSGPVVAQETSPLIAVHISAAGKPISSNLFGVFFEDLNWAADGGLYGELVRNRSFEFSAEDHGGWNELTGWDFVERDGGKGSVIIKSDSPLNANNPHYAVLGLQSNVGVAGLRNSGFDGIPVKTGKRYNFSVFARQLAGPGAPLVVRLESKAGDLLATAELPSPDSAWMKYKAVLEATNSDTDARLVLLTTGEGQVGVDMVSLFPQKTFYDRSNGLRADLAQTIADLHPKFVRFPGGCLVHGDGIDNIYNWKNTIGPVEERKGQRNIWGYHQSVGLGFYEYFQFCEDIGAKPLPVVAAGVCCQNAGESVTKVWEEGQRGLAMSDMPAYRQDVLDLIEWANGPTNSKWGAKRAASGHPASFHLQYLGIGNEDKQTEVFRERFKMIYNAVKEKYPEITVIGTVGPRPEGEDYQLGWKFSDKLRVPIVDEHYYEKPEWFLGNLHRYDGYDRGKSRVYVGEYASRGNALFNALAEAAFMTSLERNGDIVHMASYAPLLCKDRHENWRPDMIYFNNAKIVCSANYYVQQMFSCNQGDVYYPINIEGANNSLAISCVKDSGSREVVVKLVNVSTNSVRVALSLGPVGQIYPVATRIVLNGKPNAENTFANPEEIAPQTDNLTASNPFECDLSADSFTLLRIKTK